MSDPIILVIPEATPSLNKFSHAHWRVEHAAAKRWSKMLWAEAQNIGATKAAGKRKLDEDNFIGGLKSCVIDGLRKLGLLVNDDAENMQLECKQFAAASQQPYTIIKLEDI